VTPNEFDKEYGARFYRIYKKKLGSKWMATEQALIYLSACLRKFKPMTILELGAGIGTMTDAILSHPYHPKLLYTVEQNEFCLEQLTLNCSHHPRNKYNVLTTKTDIINSRLDLDLIVGDGGFKIMEEFRGTKLGTVFFVEGKRIGIQNMFKEYLPSNWTIDFKEYGVTYKWSKGKIYRLGIPWPRIHRKKGCWIGQVKERREIA
jgi:precorrin-6B methylase 2